MHSRSGGKYWQTYTGRAVFADREIAKNYSVKKCYVTEICFGFLVL